MREEIFVSEVLVGEGGPMILLPKGAVPFWRGATEYGDSTDSDYGALLNTDAFVLERYGREILILEDSHADSYLVTLPDGEIVVVQNEASSLTALELLNSLRQMPPTHEFMIRVLDTSVRLLAGTDDGEYDPNARMSGHGFRDAPIIPGIKRCHVYHSDEASVTIISSVTAGE